MFTTPFSKNHEQIFQQWIDKIPDNSLFYVIYQDFNLNTNYNQVITIKNVAKAAINKISLNNYGHIVENYNLQGIVCAFLTLFVGCGVSSEYSFWLFPILGQTRQ